MPFDGLFTHAMIAELRSKIIGGRVTKISQPFPNEVILTIRSQRHNQPLLLSAHPNYARIQITKIPYNNPPVPTNFTMTLRKYLENAKITAIDQLDNDRVANFSFATRNELGDELPLLLSIEIMGRYSNVVLVDQKDNKILDTIKHIGPSQNRFRTLLPGATYIQPPKQNLLNPFADESAKYLDLVQQFPNREMLAKQLQKSYQGIATAHALYLADSLHAMGDTSINWEHALKQADSPTPTIVGGNKNFFTFFKYDNDLNSENTESLSNLLDAFYQKKATSDRVQQQGSQLFHVIKGNLQKNRKKLKKLQQTMASTQKADILRIKGELLTTYLYQVKRGMTEIELPNYYDNEKLVKISLSNQLSPSQNAQKHFKKYQKLKNAVAYVTKQMKITKTEINYLEEVETQLELADPQDLPDIKVELQQEGYIRAQKQNKNGKVRKNKLGQPDTFYSSEDIKISVGKNNLQNDRLTLKMAQKKDIWLHAKNIHGSHVIIHDSQPSERTLLEAAKLAAYYSKARSSGNVPVDYVRVKNIRKPNGAKPGFVIYEGQQTLYVTPDEGEIKKMKKHD